jgi:transposase-like protein
LLIISDGAPGLISAAEDVFAKSLRQRCLIHRSRNLLAKVSDRDQAEIKAEYWSCFDDIEQPPGQGAVDEVRHRIEKLAKRLDADYPAAARCLRQDVGSLTVYLRFPKEHHKRIRHSNFIERTFLETRRRVKVIGRLPGEISCLSLVFAVLDRASKGWRGVKHTPATVRLCQDLRRQLLEPPVSIAPIERKEVTQEIATAIA